MQAEPCPPLSKNIHKQNVRLSPLCGAVNIFTCIFMGHHLPFSVTTNLWNAFSTTPNPSRQLVENAGVYVFSLTTAYTVCYKSGKDNPADYMSRHPAHVSHVFRDVSNTEQQVEEYVNFVTENAVPKAMTLTEIQNATKADPALCKVIQLIKGGSWGLLSEKQDFADGVDIAALKSFHKIKDKLTVTATDDTVLRGTKIVIPHSLQVRAISLAHEGHQGLVKTKKLIREKVWFPGIDRQVETMIASCIPCQAVVPNHTQEPFRMSELPSSPWEKVGVDFCGPFRSGDYLLVVIDEYSRYPEVEIMQSTSTRATIPKLDKIFSTLGIPLEVKTDNGPPFQSSEFADFATYMGI